jgi:hypothetical protein
VGCAFLFQKRTWEKEDEDKADFGKSDDPQSVMPRSVFCLHRSQRRDIIMPGGPTGGMSRICFSGEKGDSDAKNEDGVVKQKGDITDSGDEDDW